MTHLVNYLDIERMHRIKQGTMDVYLGSVRYKDAAPGDTLVFDVRGERLEATIVKVTHCDDYYEVPYHKCRMGWGRCEIYNPEFFYDNASVKENGGLYLLEFVLNK